MTEEEARKKWCPFGGEHGHSRDGYCIATDCMAWRWDREANDQIFADAKDDWEDDGKEPQLFMDSSHHADAMRLRQGYCGLAGRDE